MHNLVAVAYVISGIFFIIALRGLSSPESSRRGNIFGMLGMLIAVIATLFSVNFFTSNIQTVGLVVIAIGIGGLIAVLLAAVNIFGGFLVTQRMLAMYKKKPKNQDKK